MEKTQRDAFLSYEADNYFQRNQKIEYKAENDVVLKVLSEYNAQPKNALEIGCSTGYRLDALRKAFGAKASGIEPSSEAIEKGRSLYPDVQFYKGTADDMSYYPSASFDLVIIGFLLYVVDRHILLKVVSETDRLLVGGGVLMIIDFFSQKPARVPYEHIKEIQAYTYKQRYEEIFIASRLYQLLDKRSMNHSSKEYDLSNDFHNKFTITTLVKDLTHGYALE